MNKVDIILHIWNQNPASCISCVLFLAYKVTGWKPFFIQWFVRQDNYDSNKELATVGFTSAHLMTKLLWLCTYILVRICEALGELLIFISLGGLSDLENRLSKILKFFTTEVEKNSEETIAITTIRIMYPWLALNSWQHSALAFSLPCWLHTCTTISAWDFYFCSSGEWTQGLLHARQVFYIWVIPWAHRAETVKHSIK